MLPGTMPSIFSRDSEPERLLAFAAVNVARRQPRLRVWRFDMIACAQDTYRRDKRFATHKKTPLPEQSMPNAS
ncbi:hypothetical protein [Paenibacillus lactis]|uniref:hypothetical protein n=1 Tax=Paenibacillus lactis TaxID=228574 RepID=UPI001B25038A|nr:hypothetical protein [Paenibacillus lactis]GIO89611.1 hypothetical protein J31TS3_08380 [Paenibacillus lactis]